MKQKALFGFPAEDSQRNTNRVVSRRFMHQLRNLFPIGKVLLAAMLAFHTTDVVYVQK
jgi:hypothetical protein